MEYFIAVDEKQNLVGADTSLSNSIKTAKQFSDRAMVIKLFVETGSNEKVGPYTTIEHLATYFPPFERLNLA